jgi:hypothetical protein
LVDTRREQFPRVPYGFTHDQLDERLFADQKRVRLLSDCVLQVLKKLYVDALETTLVLITEDALVVI